MLQIGHPDPLKVESDSLDARVYPVHAGPIGPTKLMVWPCKV